MSIYARLLGIAAVVSGLGLSEALLAGDVWKGSWKFEIDRPGSAVFDLLRHREQDRLPHWLRAHFEMDAVYPGEAPKQDHTQGLDHDRQRQDADGFRRLHLRRS